MNYNHVTLVGRIKENPVIKQSTGGDKCAMFTLTVNRPYKDYQGRTQSDFVPVIAFGALSLTVDEYLSRGRLVLVEGDIDTSIDGLISVRAMSLKFLEPIMEGRF